MLQIPNTTNILKIHEKERLNISLKRKHVSKNV